ncbi:hypothetical protein [Sphaerisporangium sp. TRM90804]|uniref:hypothetical protein n=1 Tax=Sphaerisporangium sp. TRM90804 TaxID=3031113 RepID=UPI0024475200|nr:hypothetical protein [Sphaerisporangium sp. TRM90804]MDH2424991.1 hypothetical protein [Sphaerisporangium sp. TRM90804]
MAFEGFGRWPVIDPDIPDADRRRILKNAALLSDPRLSGLLGGAGIAGWFVVALAAFTGLGAFLVEVQRQLAGLSGLGAVAAIVGSSLVAALGLAWVRSEKRESPARLSHLYRAGYVIPADLDRDARFLFDRAANAVHRVQEADAALRARHLLQSNDKYHALLARPTTPRGLRTLAHRADGVEDMLARTVSEAVAAGHTLANPPTTHRW